MKKSKVQFDTASLGNMSIEDVQEHNRKVRAKAKPAVRAIMDQVQDAIDVENRDMDARLEGETKLRAWAKELCGVALDVTEIEDLNAGLQTLGKGQAFTFKPVRSKSPVTIYKTAFGTVDRLDKYIFALEKTIVDLTNRPATPAEPTVQQSKEQFTELSFFDLMKLALNRLIKRSK